MPDVTVSPVFSKADSDTFIKLPESIYDACPSFVFPLLSEERKRWVPEINPDLSLGPHWRFLATKGGQPVGRIAASVNRRFKEKWGQGTGFFGFFDCKDDLDVARALLRKAEEHLAGVGCTRVIGPINLSTQNEVGLLTDGFEKAQTLLSPYHAPYAKGLLLDAGYSEIREFAAFQWHKGHIGTDRFEKTFSRLVRRAVNSQFAVRSADPNRWRSELDMMLDLYNRCFAHVWGFTELDQTGFHSRAEEFRRFYQPKLVLVATQKGVPAGFAICLPDINVVLKALNGRMLPFGLIRAWRAQRSLKAARLLLLGVLPEHQGSGLAALLISHLREAVVAAGFQNVELSLIDTGNSNMMRLATDSGCCRTKTYKLFARDIIEGGGSV